MIKIEINIGTHGAIDDGTKEKYLVKTANFLLDLAGYQGAAKTINELIYDANTHNDDCCCDVCDEHDLRSEKTKEEDRISAQEKLGINDTSIAYQDYLGQANEVNPAEIFAKPSTIDATPGPDLDLDGLPWDARIHARTKTKTADGRWKLARGTNRAEAKKVEKELHKVMSIPTPPPPNIPMPPAIETFPTLMKKLTAAVAAGKITNSTILSVINQFEIPSIPLIATRPDLVPAISKAIDERIGGA